jgi:hypothetical protein
MAEQPGGEFTSAVPTKGSGDVEISQHQDPAKFASIHASVHNHFNLDRHLNRRDIFKQNRSTALPSGVNWRHEAGVAGEFGD